MPTYEYVCDACQESHELFKPLSAAHPDKCPACGSKEYRQDYSKFKTVGVVYDNPTTFGQQAELNAKRLGKEQMQLMAADDKARVAGRKRPFTGKLPKGASLVTEDLGDAAPPWRDDGTKPLSVAGKTPKQLKKYIETGSMS